MGKGKKNPAAHRGIHLRDLHAVRGSDEKRWDREDPEDDPLRDLRPDEEEMRIPAGNDDYVWPDLTDENEEDD
jgi:hypothetical protein